MNRSSRASMLLTAFCLAWMLPASAALESAEDIIQCMTAHVPQQAFSLQVGLEAYEGDTLTQRVLLDVLGELGPKGQLTLMTRTAAPYSGTAQRYLLRRDASHSALHVLQPDWRRARQVPADLRDATLWGTDVSLHELQEVVGLIPRSVVSRGQDATQDGRRLYVLNLRPAHGSPTRYARMEGRIDMATCLPVQLDLYGQDGALIKRLQADLSQRSVEDGRLVVHSWTIQNMATPQRRTRIYLGDVRFDVNAHRPTSMDLRGLHHW